MGSSATAVTLSWKSSICSGNPYIDDLTNLVISHYNTTLLKWESYGQSAYTGDANNGTITVNGVNTFSPFTLGSLNSNNPLPILLASFTGKAVSEGSELEWITQAEVNADRFELEHSGDGINFYRIGQVKAAGNTTRATKYRYIDYAAKSGLNYYWLNQIDNDGRSQIFNVILINASSDAKPFRIHPNPARSGEIHLGGTFSIEIFNQHGMCIMKLKDVSKVDVTGLAPGLYFIKNHQLQIASLVIL